MREISLHNDKGADMFLDTLDLDFETELHVIYY